MLASLHREPKFEKPFLVNHLMELEIQMQTPEVLALIWQVLQKELKQRANGI